MARLPSSRVGVVSRWSAVGLALALGGCGASGPAAGAVAREGEAPSRTASRASARGADASESSSSELVADARTLHADATFATLVRAAQRQDQLRDQDSEAGCLLRLGRQVRLEADLAAAVRPLPEPPEAFASRPSSVVVLTRHGAIGSPDASLALAAFTTTRPARGARARVVLVTRTALFRGATDGTRFEPVEPAALAVIDDGTSHVFVTAEASVPLARLVEVLSALPDSLSGRVGLAVALPEGTRLPATAPATSAPSIEPCDLGPLPDEAWGDVDPAAVRAGIQPLVERARACVGAAEGNGALGGRLVLTLRIGPDGRVNGACVGEDDTGDPSLHACLLRAARELRFHPPRGGSVDVAVPLRLEPGAAYRQAPVCRAGRD